MDGSFQEQLLPSPLLCFYLSWRQPVPTNLVSDFSHCVWTHLRKPYSKSPLESKTVGVHVLPYTQAQPLQACSAHLGKTSPGAISVPPSPHQKRDWDLGCIYFLITLDTPLPQTSISICWLTRGLKHSQAMFSGLQEASTIKKLKLSQNQQNGKAVAFFFFFKNNF